MSPIWKFGGYYVREKVGEEPIDQISKLDGRGQPVPKYARKQTI